MRKIAIDTNCLLTARLERSYGLSQVKKLFSDCLEGKIELILPETVILETEWVLRSYYKQDKDEIINYLEELLSIDNLKIKGNKDINVALSLYKTSSNISFTDAVILTEVQNANPDEFFTLDKGLESFYQRLNSN